MARMARIGLLVGLVVAAAGVFSASAEADVVWLCEPGMADNPCEIPQDTTVREAGEPDRVSTPKPGPREIDCFYVYPTVSNQLSDNADKSRDPELESIAEYQAARFSLDCRVFAPIYRQITLFALTGALAGGDAAGDRELAYGDVREAWREYLRRHNDGRGVVLIGHSQGTFMLRELLAEEVERSRGQRRRLVSALLLGGNVTVPEGELVGGDFARTPLCAEEAEVGCAVAFSSFAEDPPEDARFGTAEDPGMEVACTDPRALAGVSEPLRLLVPSEPFAPGPIQAGIVITAKGDPPSAETTWVTPADRYDGTCRDIGGVDVLRVEPQPGSERPNWYPEPGWGTHLIDVNIALDPLVELVARQAGRWTDPRLRLRRRCRGGKMRLRLAGRESEFVRKASFSVGGKRIERDRRAPFRAKVGTRRLRSIGGRRVHLVASLDKGAPKRLVLRRPRCL